MSDILEDFRAVVEALRQIPPPRIGSIRGTKHAIWTWLIDQGAMIETDGSPAVLPNLGPEVFYDDTIPVGVVNIHAPDGALIEFWKLDGLHWYHAVLDGGAA